MYVHIGLLAGIWPCGTITLIDELFTSESISQVYGCLHGFIHTNSTNTESIGMHHMSFECNIMLM